MASKAKPTDTTGRIREEAQKQQIEQTFDRVSLKGINKIYQ
jgi:hypothetical protein